MSGACHEKKNDGSRRVEKERARPKEEKDKIALEPLLRRRHVSGTADNEELPDGWIRVESRSKPGVFYYAHPASKRSQLERPVKGSHQPKRRRIETGLMISFKGEHTADARHIVKAGAKCKAEAEGTTTEQEAQQRANKVVEAQDQVYEEAYLKASDKRLPEGCLEPEIEPPAGAADEVQQVVSHDGLMRLKDNYERREKELAAEPRRKEAERRRKEEEGFARSEEEHKRKEEKMREDERTQREHSRELKYIEHECEQVLAPPNIHDIEVDPIEEALRRGIEAATMKGHAAPLAQDVEVDPIEEALRRGIEEAAKMQRNSATVSRELDTACLRDGVVGRCLGVVKDTAYLERRTAEKMQYDKATDSGKLAIPDLPGGVVEHCLDVVQDGAYLERLVLQGSTESKLSWTLGRSRSEKVDIVMNHESISRSHATINRHGVLAFLTDMGSAHGTVLDDQKLTKHVPARLSEHSVIRFGSCTRLYIFREPTQQSNSV